MSTYGAAIFSTSGAEQLRFVDPITAIFSFTTSTVSGSYYIRGSYTHAVSCVINPLSNYGLFTKVPIVSIRSDDYIEWYPPMVVSPYYVRPDCMVIVVFGK